MVRSASSRVSNHESRRVSSLETPPAITASRYAGMRSYPSALIAPTLRRAARRTGHQHRERKANAAGNQQRTERIVLNLFRHDLRTVAQRIAAVLVSVLGHADGGIGGVARGILGLAVQVLHRSLGFPGAARGLGLCGPRPACGAA